MKNINTEIERKYLIEYPPLDILEEKSSRVIKMVQTYLLSEKGVDKRVRSSTENGITTYTTTEKRKISLLSRFEDEREIDKEEYEKLLFLVDEKFFPIEKTRYCVPVGKYVAEIDVYKNISSFAICEVELETESEEPFLPNCVTLIREVTGEKKYSNRELSKIK